ncbi:MAG: PilN domain-containing protein [Nitrospirae bacterium]|nr:PilN domain-containing protein [Nitrospirota bacterium]
MIKVNLLSTKKKKKQKPVPAFLIYAVLLTLAVGAIFTYITYHFSSTVSAKEAKVKENEKTIAALKEKIKAVEDFEKLNKTFQQRKDIIEELGRNKSRPIKILDEISALLPAGVWLGNAEVKGLDVSLSCTAFTNTDVVNYVNNLKNSKLFTDVYLQESVQSKVATTTVYSFKLTFKVKA